MASRIRAKSTFAPNAAGALRESGSIVKVPTSNSMTNLTATTKTPAAAPVVPAAPAQVPVSAGGSFYRVEPPEGLQALPVVSGFWSSAEQARQAALSTWGVAAHEAELTITQA